MRRTWRKVTLVTSSLITGTLYFIHALYYLHIKTHTHQVTIGVTNHILILDLVFQRREVGDWKCGSVEQRQEMWTVIWHLALKVKVVGYG